MQKELTSNGNKKNASPAGTTTWSGRLRLDDTLTAGESNADGKRMTERQLEGRRTGPSSYETTAEEALRCHACGMRSNIVHCPSSCDGDVKEWSRGLKRPAAALPRSVHREGPIYHVCAISLDDVSLDYK